MLLTVPPPTPTATEATKILRRFREHQIGMAAQLLKMLDETPANHWRRDGLNTLLERHTDAIDVLDRITIEEQAITQLMVGLPS